MTFIVRREATRLVMYLRDMHLVYAIILRDRLTAVCFSYECKTVCKNYTKGTGLVSSSLSFIVMSDIQVKTQYYIREKNIREIQNR